MNSDLLFGVPLVALAAADVYLGQRLRHSAATQQRLQEELAAERLGAATQQRLQEELAALQSSSGQQLRECQKKLDGLQAEHNQLRNRNLCEVRLTSKRLFLVGALASGKTALCDSWCGRDPAKVERTKQIQPLDKIIAFNKAVGADGVTLLEHQRLECFDMPGEATIDGLLQALRDSDQNAQAIPRGLLFVIALWPYPGPGPGLTEEEALALVEGVLDAQKKSFELNLHVLGKSNQLCQGLKATALFFNKVDLLDQQGPVLRGRVDRLIEPFATVVKKHFPDVALFKGSAMTGEQCPGLLRHFVDKVFP